MNKETLIQQIENLNESDKLTVHNLMCDFYNRPDDTVYNNDEDFFNEMLHGTKPYEIARMIHFGDWNFAHDYVRFDGYGNLESAYNVDDLIDADQIAECVLEYPNEFTDWLSLEEDEEE